MNRELAEVRRYWPDALRVREKGGNIAYRSRLAPHRWCGWSARWGEYYVGAFAGPTLVDAMRKAGYEPSGRFAPLRAWLGACRLSRENRRNPKPSRPRKGARLGKRKREIELRAKPVSCGWHAAVSEIVASFGDKLFPAMLVKPLTDATISALPLVLDNMRSPPELLVVDDEGDVDVASFAARDPDGSFVRCLDRVLRDKEAQP